VHYGDVSVSRFHGFCKNIVKGMNMDLFLIVIQQFQILQMISTGFTGFTWNRKKGEVELLVSI
jgi:hypothetical protein